MSKLPWLESHWQHLIDYSSQNRVPQALLISGHKGFGKLQLAREYTAALLCDNPQQNGLACECCNSCLLFKAQSHPDFIQLQPLEAGKNITIDQIRQLITRLSLKPQFDGYRVVIIEPAELMNNAAANAFLKYLEEPTERTVVILITDKPTRLLATIVSRCQKIAINQPDKAVLNSWLQQHTQQENISLILSLAQGSPLLALQYANENILKLRNECFEAWLNISQQHIHPIIVAENWTKLTEVPLLTWMTTWIIDLIKCRFAIELDNLYNPDKKDYLQALVERIESKGLYELYDLLLIRQKLLDTTVNKQLLYEEILITWSDLNIRNKT
ncbi:MAG: DNA polymerase III subunit delta' [Methylococcales bacterium]|nr:MAG: DNA polymerase III subunit delta' [Methylococcales bacterium]